MYNYDDDAPTNQYPAEHLPEFFGYVPLAATDDGDMLCYWCVADPTNPVHVSTGDEPHPDGWGITSWFCDGDIDTVEYCAHCNRQFGPESTAGGECPYCDLAFSQDAALAAHIAQHRGA